jgi:hypothetical protein
MAKVAAAVLASICMFMLIQGPLHIRAERNSYSDVASVSFKKFVHVLYVNGAFELYLGMVGPDTWYTATLWAYETSHESS